MPGVATHLLVLEETITELEKRTKDQKTPNTDKKCFKELTRILKDNPNFAQLGAIGPDLTFFIGTPQWIMGNISDIFSFTRQVKDVFDDISNCANNLGMPNLVNRIQQLGGIVDGLIVTFETVLVNKMVSVGNFFVGNLFGGFASRQEGKPLQKWEWNEILHSYRTGQAASKFLYTATQEQNDEWYAYALGYITHLATDIAGHSYVNQVTGGQPRAFKARHHLSENFIDTFAWWEIKNQEAAGAKFHTKIDIGGRSNDFATMFSKVLKELYQESTSIPNPQFHLPVNPTASEIKKAFTTLQSLLAFISDVLYLSPPPAPSIEIPPLPGETGSWLNWYVEDVLTSGGGDNSIWDILLAILKTLGLILVFLADMIRFAVDIITGVITYPIAGALWFIQMGLYYLYRFLIKYLVMCGVLYPFHDELAEWIGTQFTSSYSPDPLFPRQPQPWEEFDYVIQLINIVFTATLVDSHYLNYPNTPTEEPRTLSSPYANESPLFFIRQAEVSPQYRKRSLQASRPSDLNTLNEQIRLKMFSNPIYRGGKTEHAAFGSAVKIAIDLMTNRLPLKIDYDLDSDRSYSYRCWLESVNHLSDRVIDPKWTL